MIPALAQVAALAVAHLGVEVLSLLDEEASTACRVRVAPRYAVFELLLDVLLLDRRRLLLQWVILLALGSPR